jgi:hypothetical protein
VLSLAGVYLSLAYSAFKDDKRIPWRTLPGNVPRERERVWVDALKEALKHHEQIERLLSS